MAVVARQMLKDQVREVMLERILEGDWAPGERIVETQVASEFGISQGPVREALRELETLGMVVSEPYRGARVREVTPAELAEVYPVRALLEGFAAQEAAKRLAGDVGALEAELSAMRAAAGDGDTHRLLSHDVLFHRLIVEAADNRVLLQTWSSLRIEARTLITIIKSVGDLHEIAESHVPVLEALRSGDGRRAGAALRKHVTANARWVPSA